MRAQGPASQDGNRINTAGKSGTMDVDIGFERRTDLNFVQAQGDGLSIAQVDQCQFILDFEHQAGFQSGKWPVW